MANSDNDDDNRKDLTRIEDLSEFLHVEDSNLDDIFGGLENKSLDHTKTDIGEVLDFSIGADLEEVSDLSELPDLPELPKEDPSLLEFNDSTEGNLEAESDNEPEFQNSDNSAELHFDEALDTSNSTDENFSFDSTEPLAAEEFVPDFAEVEEELASDFAEIKDEPINDLLSPTHSLDQFAHQEKFEEVKTFAQNFSYGQIQGGGNPPFSLIIRNVKFTEEAEDILLILRDFGLITEQNRNDSAKSLELGSLLVPQISEYSAIVLAHKLRRFDCDIEVGLSDEVHPSKSGDTNPRGLMSKAGLAQNKKEHFKKDEFIITDSEILVSSLSTLEGYVVQKYLGVQTSFIIVDKVELERLMFVQNVSRAKSELHQYETEDSISNEKAFQDYQNSFDLLFTELCDQLKEKAKRKKANAILGLQYQLNCLTDELSSDEKNRFQLLCTATLAVVKNN